MDQIYIGQFSGDIFFISKFKQVEKKESNKLIFENFGVGDIIIGFDKIFFVYYFYLVLVVLD